MERYTQALRSHNLRSTLPRKTVFDVLATAEKPLSMRDLVKQCPSIDRVTLYRTLNTFMQAGIVRVVPVGWKRMYELTESFAPHHHHMICTQCGTVIDIMSPEIEAYITRAAEHAGFIEQTHVIEIHGRCVSCGATELTGNLED